MIHKGKIRLRSILPLFLCTCLLMQAVVYPVKANDRAGYIIGSTALSASGLVTETGLTGQGQLVGIADSGLDKGSMTDIHPDLQSSSGSNPKIILQSFTDRSIPDDPTGHGTFMAATIAGTGKASSGKYKGIAPGASLYFQALLNQSSNIQVPADLSQLFLPAYSAGVRIHVNGWGSGANTYGDHTAAIDKFTYYYRDFLPVFGAGNNGPGVSTLTSEANSKNALVIGSSQVPRPGFDTDARVADKISIASSRGPTGDKRIKPDLLVPGSALISACSSLTESNFAANQQYTRMGGTSMATAVTGGALALLREQLSRQFNLDYPSSALLKALLINGARPNPSGDLSEGFGILDLAGTSLALKEGTFRYVDQSPRLGQGGSSVYKFNVVDASMPVKVTLAWIDPPAKAGSGSALMNDLDLTLRDSSGHFYYGNDFNHQGTVDKVNNVEQVVIAVPQPGEYTVTVNAAQIKSGINQDFALVYGQGLQNGTVCSQAGSQLTLTDGTKINLTNQETEVVNDGVMQSDINHVLAGSNIYKSGRKTYLLGETWQTGGVQALQTDQGSLILEMNSQSREGGYYIDAQVDSQPGSIKVNGLPVSSASLIPSGSEISATLNPFLQTIWELDAFNQQVIGFIEKIDADNRELKLINDNKPYKLASWVSINYQDQVIDCDIQDAPYSTSEKSTLDMLLPGTAITMQVSTRNQVVQTVQVKRPLLVGKVVRIDRSGEIELSTGKNYKIFPGCHIYRDDKEVNLGDIQVGDLLTAQLLPDSNFIVKLQTNSNTVYGRVIYANTAKKTINVMDANNQLHTYTIDSQTEVFGLGVQVDASSLNSGNWIRIIADPDSNQARRIDVAEKGEESSEILEMIDYSRKTLQMKDGSIYEYGDFTRMSQGGYYITPDDLVNGETLKITTLTAPSPWLQVLAGVEVEAQGEEAGPYVRLTAQSLNGVLIVQGSTDADRLYIYRQDGNRERIDVSNKVFNRIFNMLDKESGVSVVALNMKTGTMKDIYVEIQAYQNETTPAGFIDVNGHWAETYINELADKGVVQGYEDGTFRPDQPISRAELMVMLAQLRKLEVSDMPTRRYFIDQENIPWWALSHVLASRRDGLVYGYPDGTFRPYQAVTRSELDIIYAHLVNKPVENLFPGDALHPNRVVTRAEAAAILMDSL